jgi:GAF domain-containing protein/two-component sensor histidine kinase
MPMLRDGQGIGAIHVARLAEGSFTDVELALLRTFADQAVIAIENVRLFQELETRNRELTEGLEREMATADLLRIISSSPTDLAPVFESILDRALVLCSATMGAVGRREADLVSVVALKGPPEQAKVVHAAYPRRLTDPGYMVRAIRERRTMQVADMLAEPMPIPIPGIRSQLMVPMLKDGEALGAIVVNRPESGLFSPAQVKLLETFADQAVIAIENVRLFTELGARNRELTESLEQQTATAEILRVISQSPTDTRPVFRSIVESAVRLCDGRIGALYRIDDGTIDVMASKMADDEARRAHDASYPRPLADLELPMQRLALEAAPVHLMDVDADPRLSDAFRARARVQGYRTGVLVPTVREGRTIGVISVGRAGAGRTPRPFSEREIALLQTFADQAVIAIENTRLFQELQARNRELTEALEQQTATAEILRVISSSPTDVQPVFDSILERAMRLADAVYGAAFSFDGELIHQVAHRGLSDEALAMARRVYPMAPSSEQLTGVAVLEQRVIHVRDVDTAPEASAMTRQFARTIGFRALLAVPMLREGRPVGVLTLTRAAGEFSARHIELVEMFADQAVIAIENVRLFTELGARNRELSESLEQQTATAEILRAISSSPTDTQPVFDTIAQSAVRLCDGRDCFVWRFDGTLVDIVAHHGFSSDVLNGFRRMYPVPIEADTLSARSIRERAVVHRPDIPNDPDVSEFVRQIARMGGYRTGVVVPMLRSGSPIGAIGVTRGELTAEPRPFSDKEIALLQTFTDQAVIAIENVRLFTELGARNRDLTEALEQQTATSEILRAISSSPTDTQPVFDTIAQRAVRVCDGRQCSVYQLDGALVRFVAHYGLPPEALEAFQRVYPLTLDADTLAVRSIHDGAVVHVPDLVTDLSETSRRFGEAGGFRSAVVVPMLRSGRAVGAIGIGRGGPDGAPRPFTEKEIALLQTFADQGVIAVENVRLFRELETRTRELARSVEELRALSEVGRAVSSTLDLPTVLATIVARAVQLSGTSSGVLYEYDEATQTFHLQASHQTEAEVVEALRASPIQVGEGATGRAVAQRTPVEVVDILDDQQFRTGLRTILTRLGYRSVLSIPFLAEQRILGALTVSRREPGHFPPDTVNLLQTFATQSALAIQNARLFREIEAKGRELEVASRHKSQFLANMSHELRTPLNAILGYTELMVDGIYGDLPQKAGDVMARIDRSGKHLLGLINDVLDLSKIEAGQLELALADYSLAEMVNAVMTQVESLAGEKGLLLQATVAPNLPAGRGDERRLAQVLLNLVGNALKFAEAGAVRIGAYQEGDAFVVSVADTGPGIAEADRQRIFEEFQQADSSSTRKKGGTGLGLSIARRIVELHGGRIWVESTVGRGSTFSFRVPVRVERQAARV